MQSDPRATPGVHEGEILAGKYRIDRVLGTGGMGVVVAAHHIQLEEKVAIKFLLPEALSNAEAVARFSREARAAIKIKSEHVARVIDVGTLDTGAPYIVMEYLEGQDLSAWIQQKGAMSVEQAVEFVLQACEAIAEAHGIGIIHRDLKPANLFCIRRSDGLLAIKVLDFGISKVTGMSASGADMGMTKTAAVMGSPLYMSPEQMQSSRDVDATTDIWSLGVILYQILAGDVPFTGDTLPEVCVKIAMQPPAPIRSLRPDIPPGLEAVILKCLEKDRAKRYRNVAEFAASLASFGPKRVRASVDRIARIIQSAGLTESAVNLPPSSIPPTDPQHPGEPQHPGTLASWGHTAGNPPRNGRAGRMTAAVVGVVVLLAGVGIWVWRASSGTAPTVTSSAAALTSAAPVVAGPAVGAMVNPAPAEPLPTAAMSTGISAPSHNAQPALTPPATVPPAAHPASHSTTASSGRLSQPEPKPHAGPTAPKTGDLGGRL